jgi:hypoxanthine phosphoribosyltransferase
MLADIERVLISREQIARRVAEMAGQITADRAGGEITIVPVMTGAMIFCADLIRQIPMAMKIGLLMVSSYPGAAIESQGPKILAGQNVDVRGRHVLLVDDVLDSGKTIGLVAPMLKEAGAAAVKVCVLLRKDRPVARAIHVDYVGFDIPDEFVVGYGLDFNDYYRNLPEIVALKRAILLQGGAVS